MIYRTIRSVIAIILSIGLISPSFAQPPSKQQSTTTDKPPKKPYKILTNGKRITIQSSRNLKSVLVWTSDGYRIIEQQELNVGNFSFELQVKEKIFFLRIELDNGKLYTEKIGVQ